MHPESVPSGSEVLTAAESDLFVCEGMKAKLLYERPPQSSLSADEQVRLEIQRFLEALRSYPDRAAKEPNLTFEQHLYALVSPGQDVPRRRT
jgi:hypothetical protein